MWNLCHSVVIVSYFIYPTQEVKLTVLDLAPKRHVLVFMKKFVQPITRHFISLVRAIIAQRTYYEELCSKENFK